MNHSRWAAPSASLSQLSLSDKQTRDEDLFASPPPKQSSKGAANTQQAAETQAQRATSDAPASSTTSSGQAENANDAALRAELESLRKINSVIEGVTSSLSKARGNMDAINATVNASHTLLDTWTRILSQTEHNQRLLLNPAWSGASQDLQDAENETLLRAQQRQRREAEEAERRAALEDRRRAEEERRAAEAENGPGTSAGGGRPASGARGRGRGRTPAKTSTVRKPPPSNDAAGLGAAKAGRGAPLGYGRVGSAGTRGARARGRGVG